MDEIKTLLENVLSKTSDMKQAFIDLAPNSRMNMGIIGVWMAMGMDWLCRSLCFVIRFVKGKWQEYRVV